jgi:hypothetical protein
MTPLEATLFNLGANFDVSEAWSEHVLFGSTPLIMRGILDREPGDVDVFVTKRVWGRLLSRPGWDWLTPQENHPPILVAHLPLETHLFFEWRDPACEMDAEELIRTAEHLGNWRCVSVEEALRVKEDAYAWLARDPKVAKHGPDIEIIKQYLQREAS